MGPMCNTGERALEVAVEALEKIADEKQTSLRWRRSTGGQRPGSSGLEKPNVRMVALEALGRLGRQA